MNEEMKHELERTSKRLYIIYKELETKTSADAAIANLLLIAYQAIDAAVEIKDRPF